MTLEGAINLNETNDYVVYTMNSITTGQYGVVVPKNVNGTLNMLVDLHMKGSFDGVSTGVMTKEQLVSLIDDEYNKLKVKYADGMLVMPMIDEVVFQNTVLTGDKQKMFDEVKKIGAITSELYKKLTDSGVDKQKIDQKIIIVEKNAEDEKFVLWLKEQMPNFVDGILYSELGTVQANVDTVASAGLFGAPVSMEEQKNESAVTPVVPTPASVEPVVTQQEVVQPGVFDASTQINVGGIFDNVAPTVSEVALETPVAPVESVVQVVPEVVAEAPVEPVVPVAPEIAVQPVVTPAEQSQNNGVNLFETTQMSQPVQNVETVNNVVTSTAPVASESAPVVEGPKPVESAMLEGTIAFTPIPNHPNNVTEPVANVESPVEDTKKGSKGFVNLAILLVVLVGVTLISIELGKYLYDVYGA